MFEHDFFRNFLDIEPRLQIYYKCIKTKLSGASFSVFVDNNNDNEDIDERRIKHKTTIKIPFQMTQLDTFKLWLEILVDHTGHMIRCWTIK